MTSLKEIDLIRSAYNDFSNFPKILLQVHMYNIEVLLITQIVHVHFFL